MRTLLRVVGGIWAVIGVLNITSSPAMGPNDNGLIGPTAVILFNALLFIAPGLLMAGVGSIIKKKELEKKCPYCAEMIKTEATRCRFCNSEL